jgi:hypothetical protein
MLKAEKYWKSISKTPEELNTHFTNHAYNFKEKTRLMSNISDDEMNRVVKEYGLEEAKQMVETKPKKVPKQMSDYGDTSKFAEQKPKRKYTKKLDTTSKVTPKTAEEQGWRKSPLPKGTASSDHADYSNTGKQPLPSAEGTSAVSSSSSRTARVVKTTPRLKTRIPTRTPAAVRTPKLAESAEETSAVSSSSSRTARAVSKGSRIKSIISKSLPIASKTGRLASRVMGSGVVRAAGTAGMVIGAAGDIMNISKAAREVRKAIIYKPVESIPRKITTNEQVTNLAKAKSKRPKSIIDRELESKFSQAQRNQAVGQKYGWGIKQPSKSIQLPQPKRNSGVDTKPTSVTPTIKTNKPTKPTKPKVSTPYKSSGASVIPKRPDEIKDDMAFLSPLQISPSKRTSPVRPIPTRVQMPEQFMSPSMRLASLPKISRYKLGVSR